MSETGAAGALSGQRILVTGGAGLIGSPNPRRGERLLPLLPLFNGMSEMDQDRVADALAAALSGTSLRAREA